MTDHVVVAIFGDEWDEIDQAEVGPIFGPMTRAEAESLRDRLQHAANAARDAATDRQHEWGRRRRELFGDKWPLSEEESHQLGTYPSFAVGVQYTVSRLCDPDPSYVPQRDHDEDPPDSFRDLPLL